MSEKNTKLILWIAIATLSLAIVFFALFFIGRIMGNNHDSKNNSDGIGLINIDNKLSDNMTGLKNRHPEYQQEQLEAYGKIATAGNVDLCEDRNDKNDCISSVAFITEKNLLCNELGNEQLVFNCMDEVFSETGNSSIDGCLNLSESDDNRVMCLVNVFLSYKIPDNCSHLKVDKVRQTCEGVLYFQLAAKQNNKKQCDNIKDDFIKKFCQLHIK